MDGDGEVKDGERPEEKVPESKVTARGGQAREQQLPIHPPRVSQTRSTITIDERPRADKFSEKELRVLREQFMEISRHHRMDRGMFRQSLGILGMVRDSAICDRLFNSFCTQGDNGNSLESLTFEQYTRGLEIMTKGTLAQKLNFGFDVIDSTHSGFFTVQDLAIIVQSLSHIFTGIMGQDETSVSEQEIQAIFDLFDPKGTGRCTREQFRFTFYRFPNLVLRFGENNSGTMAIQQSQKNYELETNKAEIRGKTLDIVDTELHELKQLVLELGKKCSVDAGDASADDLRQAVGEFVDSYVDTLDTVESTLSATAQRIAELTKGQHDVARSRAPTLEEGGASKGDSPVAEQPGGFNRIVSVGPDAFECLLSFPLDSAANLGQSEMEQTLIAATRDAQSCRDIPGLIDAIMVARANGIPNSNIAMVQAVNLQERIDELIQESKKQLGKRLNSSKGNAVVFGHKNWDLVMNVMQGLQLAVSRTSAEAHRPLSAFDFGTKEKYTLVPGNRLRRKRNGRLVDDPKAVRFVDYSPFVWKRLRSHFGINDEEYVQSLGPGSLISNLVLGSLTGLSELGSEGKSGSFFYYTSDGKYMVKTISHDEHQLLKTILEDYYTHMVNPEMGHRPSLLCRILGHHQIRKTKNDRKQMSLYFVVMANCFSGSLTIDRRFDLKGSWVGRRTKSEEDRNNPAVCLKDVDAMDMHIGMDVEDGYGQQLVRTLTRDSLFLADNHIIDYSLLLGVHITTPEEMEFYRQRASIDETPYRDRVAMGLRNGQEFYQLDDGGMLSRDFSKIYYVGIIDILTEYNNTKRAEKFAKLFLKSADGVSVQEPPVYQRRFQDFLTMLIGASSESFTNGEMDIPRHWRRIMRHARRKRLQQQQRRSKS